MNNNRLRDLAGLSSTIQEQYEASEKEFALLEREYSTRDGYVVDTNQVSIEQLQKRLDATSRALGFANKLRDPRQKLQHLSRVMSNMNIVRSALKFMIKEAENEQARTEF